MVADRFNGKRLNSPNDVVVKSDGTIWFTDPVLRHPDPDLRGPPEGEQEYGGCYVFVFDPKTGELRRVAADDFGAEAQRHRLEPPETRSTSPTPVPATTPTARATSASFDVGEERQARCRSRVFATCNSGLFDGFRCDSDGRVWSSAGDGVHCYASDGTMLGKILVPEVVANVCFGGRHRNRLFITATTSLYSIYLLLRGAPTV